MGLFNNKTTDNSSITLDEFPVCSKVNFATMEAYKRLRTNVIFSFADIDGCKVVGVTSSVRGEGKSLTSVNLAYSMAQDDKKVILIDADLRLSSVATKLEIEKEPGLSNVLVGQLKVKDVIKEYKDSDESKSFYVITSGNEVPNPAELLGSDKMANVLEELKNDFDYIFVDLPPVCAVADALITSKLTNGMVVVVRQDICHTDNLKECVDQLKFANANILGFVYNGATSGSGSYGKYKKYGKYYKNSYTDEPKTDKTN